MDVQFITFQPIDFACSTAAPRSLSDAKTTLSLSSSSYYTAQNMSRKKAELFRFSFTKFSNKYVPLSEASYQAQYHPPFFVGLLLSELSNSVFL